MGFIGSFINGAGTGEKEINRVVAFETVAEAKLYEFDSGQGALIRETGAQYTILNFQLPIYNDDVTFFPVNNGQSLAQQGHYFVLQNDGVLPAGNKQGLNYRIPRDTNFVARNFVIDTDTAPSVLTEVWNIDDRGAHTISLSDNTKVFRDGGVDVAQITINPLERIIFSEASLNQIIVSRTPDFQGDTDFVSKTTDFATDADVTARTNTKVLTADRILNENNFISDSQVHAASQASVKAHADNTELHLPTTVTANQIVRRNAANNAWEAQDLTLLDSKVIQPFADTYGALGAIPADASPTTPYWTILRVDDIGTGDAANPQYPKGFYLGTAPTTWNFTH